MNTILMHHRRTVVAFILVFIHAAAYAGVGDMPACTTVQGTVNFTNPQSILGIDIIGETPCSGYDRLTADTLNVTGGTIQIRLIAGYAPVGGEVFDVLNWTTLNGEFQTIDLSQAALAEGLGWDTSQLHTTGEIFITGGAEAEQLPIPNWMLVLLTITLFGVGWRRAALQRQ